MGISISYKGKLNSPKLLPEALAWVADAAPGEIRQLALVRVARHDPQFRHGVGLRPEAVDPDAIGLSVAELGDHRTTHDATVTAGMQLCGTDCGSCSQLALQERQATNKRRTCSVFPYWCLQPNPRHK